MSTVIRGIFSKAEVFVNTGTNCPSFLKATGSPSTKMISELFVVSVSTRAGTPTSPVEYRMSDVAAKIFEESLNKVVLVQLKGGRSVRGRLYSFDQHMNLVLEEAEDVTNSDAAKKLGTIIVRGDNVVLVSPPPKR